MIQTLTATMAATRDQMKIDIDENERTLLNNAMEGSIMSAQRQQNTKGKTPAMVEVWKHHEVTLRALQTKINAAK